MRSSIYPWQRTLWERLDTARGGSRLHHALLICGVRGMGKQHFAETLAQAHLCRYRDSEGFACGECGSCRQYRAGTHPDLLQVFPEKEGGVIPVDSVRRVGEFLTLKSHHGSGRVVVLQPADAMNVAAANSLLTIVRRPHPLKDWARRIKKRSSHKKACVALARKLAVIMHRMLITGEAFRWPQIQAAV